MSVLKITELNKSFGADQLFANVNFELQKGDKAGLIGANGAGKSTLLRCILGLESLDSGNITIPSGYTIGYVEQDAGPGENTLSEELRLAFSDIVTCQAKMRELESALSSTCDESIQAEIMHEYAAAVEQFERNNGYAYENMIRRVASGLGFSEEDMSRKLKAFSGGQKTRIMLAKVLVRQPDFLFLDEPTNHLDIGMTEWLEDFLRDYPGGVLIISHDRYFLDKVVGQIFEMDKGTLKAYRGNYESYFRQKTELIASQQNAYDKQQAYIAKTEEYINKYRAGIKSKQARGRQSQLSRLDRLDSPTADKNFNLNFDISEGSAERVAELIDVKASYGEKIIFPKISLLIRQNEGVALIGPNGAGKTTLLKLLIGKMTPSAGKVKLGNRVKIGYFAQEHEGLNPNYRVIDEIMSEFGFSEERARSSLGSFLFSGDDVFKIVGELSGGEKARLTLLKLMLSGANFLILDEPTNHLDIAAKEAVEDAILAFPGTFLVVSHDRYLLDKVADRILELSDGNITEYLGNYSYYHNKKAMALKQKSTAPVEKAPKPKPERPRRPQDKAKQVIKLEAEIATIENELSILTEKLNDPASHDDPSISRQMADEYAELEKNLSAKYDEWIELTTEESSE